MDFEKTIQIFCCDHRKNIDWKLPYIRFGGTESECALKFPNTIEGIDVNADETPKIYWLWKTYKQFGNLDYIGYCQYRRFFARVEAKYPIVDIPARAFRNEFVIPPSQQQDIIEQLHVDGILHDPIDVIDDRIIPFKYIWEQIFILSQNDIIKHELQKKVFDIFLDHTPGWLKEFMLKAFEEKKNYLCNVFTVKSEIFDLFGNIAFPSIKDVLNLESKEEKSKYHPYWLAFILERYTSCFYHALEFSGKYSFVKAPLLTIDANIHIEWNSSEKVNSKHV